jgi:hypothetical protein
LRLRLFSLLLVLAVPGRSQRARLVVPEIEGLLTTDGAVRALVGPAYLPVSGNFALDE